MPARHHKSAGEGDAGRRTLSGAPGVAPAPPIAPGRLMTSAFSLQGEGALVPGSWRGFRQSRGAMEDRAMSRRARRNGARRRILIVANQRPWTWRRRGRDNGLFDKSIADRTARKAARTKPIRPRGAGGRIDRPGVKRRANEANPPRRVGAARRGRVACRTRANEPNFWPGVIASTSCRSSPCVVLGAIVARIPRERSQSGRESDRGDCGDRKAGRGGPPPRERSQSRGSRAGLGGANPARTKPIPRGASRGPPAVGRRREVAPLAAPSRAWR